MVETSGCLFLGSRATGGGSKTQRAVQGRSGLVSQITRQARGAGLGCRRRRETSGGEIEMPFTVVATFRNGLVTHFTDYGDRGKAVEAAGLRK